MIRKTVWASTALAVAITFSPVQAGSLLGPSSQPAAENLVQSVKMKRKHPMRMTTHKMSRKMKRHRGHRMARSHGGCKGTYMYRKKGKCMDARNKS
jgi:hypothetical protein